MIELVLIVVIFKFIDSTTTVYRLYNLKQGNMKKIFLYSLVTEAAWMISFYYASRDDNIYLIMLFIITRVIANYSALEFVNLSKKDFVSLKVITSKKDILIDELRKYSINPVVLEVHGHHNKKDLLYITVSKNMAKRKLKMIKELDNKAFITVSNVLEIG